MIQPLYSKYNISNSVFSLFFGIVGELWKPGRIKQLSLMEMLIINAIGSCSEDCEETNGMFVYHYRSVQLNVFFLKIFLDYDVCIIYCMGSASDDLNGWICC